MSLVNSFETSLLQYMFNNTGLADFGDAAGIPVTVGAGDMFVSLHTADPGEAAASQSVSELTYTGYARQGIARATGANGWLVTTNVADNVTAEQMGENTGGSQTSTDFALGFAVSGATAIYMKGAAALVISIGVNPEFAAGALDVSLD
jgi:hypothetical protein